MLKFNVLKKNGQLAKDTVSKVLDVLTVQNKDVRKAVWTNKEVRRVYP